MTSQPWILGCAGVQQRVGVLLQWSHDLSAMDTCVDLSDDLRLRALQWSHDLSAMDTGELAVCEIGDDVASMEP